MLRRTNPAIALAAAAAVALGGCTGSGEPRVAEPGTVAGFAGAVAADAPHAAMVGRDILGNNGNAVDAAVGMAFTMAVTMPSRAGLGGGGACVVHKRDDRVQQALLFFPGVADKGAAVPALARGMAALHARHGLNRWATLVRPAEKLAAFGHDISRAFRRDLAAARGRLGPEARRIFLQPDGSVPEVGQRLKQPALGTALAGIRQRGAGHLTTGSFARGLVEGAGARGHALTLADLRGQVPGYVEPATASFGDQTLVTAPAPVGGGASVAGAWQRLRKADLGAADTPARWQGLFKAWETAARDTGATDALAAPNGAATGEGAGPGDVGAGFAVGDRFGNFVACGLTMNALFGSGDVAGGTGILMAEPIPPARAARAVAPAVIGSPHSGRGLFAATAAGDAVPGALMLDLLARIHAAGGVDRPYTTAAEGNKATQRRRPGGAGYAAGTGKRVAGAKAARIAPLLGAARLGLAPDGGRIHYEREIPAGLPDGLQKAGYATAPVRAVGRLAVVHCPRGPVAEPETCTAAADPRGDGMAALAQ